MGIALLSFVDLFMPLQSLASRWIPSRRRSASGLRYVGIRPSCAVRPATPASRLSAPRPLRVVRTVDAQHKGASTGRVVISGRMADVCAELDRLAALEAAGAAPSPGCLH
ncbi:MULTISPECIES: hypothetical protein [unclassified Variovorax]|uniref:hypothetical protein n=1 Tax=unclassified Variovorax TaxID=663243 RepID=UPI00076D23B6|nr:MULTISPECIES: hypothetical protein [unclassified Variovorax]KWT85224.1 hypothetical protein APY03_4027 [Variovorax sp. WDL1]PNG56658.1 hypothetical protein CHC07_03080 [Variovorax sp. B4]PNG58082.1 hypothetical protein CHC06_03083 [Variovorax sp. B2]VTV09427.1 hypothetical protein WDL1CHR_00542 [Variovorax sp. WDL1]